MIQKFFVVVNGAGFVTCTTDNGQSNHHAALWTSHEAAVRHAEEMMKIQCRAIDLRMCTTPTRFDVMEVEITPVVDRATEVKPWDGIDKDSL